MKVVLIIPKILYGSWIKNITIEDIDIQLEVYILVSDIENRGYRSFFKLDKKLFKGAKSLRTIDNPTNHHYVSEVDDIKVKQSSTHIFNFTGTLVKNQLIRQYEFFINKSGLIFKETINSTILPNYKKVQLIVKKGKEEFRTSVRFDPISVSKNLDLVLATFSGIIKSNLQDLLVIQKGEELKSSIISFSSLFKYAIRFCKKTIDYKFYSDQWLIAYQFETKNKLSPFCFESTVKIIPPKDRFWADPIVIFENEIYYIFIEELLYDTDKGHISVFEINKDGSVTQPVKIIENEYHMSYPFVFKYEDKFYMIPETSHNNTIDLYKAKNFPYEWEFEKTIFNNIKATDTTLVFKNQKWWMFTSIKEFENGTYDNVLSVFNTDNPISGSWKKQIKNTVKNDIENSRQGGPFFKDENENLFRVSQNGSNTYGYGYNVHKIVELSETSFREELVYNYKATDKEIIGVHTFNKVRDIQVYDVLKRIKKT